MQKVKFKYFPNRPKKLTVEFAVAEYKKLLDRVPEAENSKSPAKWLKLFADINELDAYIGSEAGRIFYKNSQNMADKKSEAKMHYIREKLSPALSEPGHQLLKAIVKSRYLEAIAKKYGERLPIIYRLALKPSDPINKDLNVATARLSNKYHKLIATAQVKVLGKSMTLWQARALRSAPDEPTRQASFLATSQWFGKHHHQLSVLFNELVELRAKKASNIGYKTYIPFAYEAMGRTDYAAVDIKKYRQLLKKYFVPLHKQIIGRQAKLLGKRSLKPWDAAYNTPTFNPLTSLPQKIVPINRQLTDAQRLFKQLSPWLGQCFADMRKFGLIDLANRPNKQAGAYCMTIPDEGRPRLLCNSTGDCDDISTLTHEMGHAFQAWASATIYPIDLQGPTADLCEVHSMGMEFLAMPYLKNFFSSEHAKKFALGHYEEVVNTLLYVAIVDEFQHWIYQSPKSTPAQRDRKWCELFDIYLPGIDWQGYQKYKKARWYAQGHIFTSPFYYIDYALAQTGAMQIAMVDARNHRRAMKIYMKLCNLGGTKSFLAALKHVGLRSPFDENLIRELAAHTKKTLDLV